MEVVESMKNSLDKLAVLPKILTDIVDLAEPGDMEQETGDKIRSIANIMYDNVKLISASIEMCSKILELNEQQQPINSDVSK